MVRTDSNRREGLPYTVLSDPSSILDSPGLMRERTRISKSRRISRLTTSSETSDRRIGICCTFSKIGLAYSG